MVPIHASIHRYNWQGITYFKTRKHKIPVGVGLVGVGLPDDDCVGLVGIVLPVEEGSVGVVEGTDVDDPVEEGIAVVGSTLA